MSMLRSVVEELPQILGHAGSSECGSWDEESKVAVEADRAGD